MPLRADIIAGNFSAQNPPFDPNPGDAWTIGTSSNEQNAVVFQSSAATSGLLTQIQLGVNFSASDPNSSTTPSLSDLIVGLWENTTNNLNTAAELQSWSVAPAGSAGLPGQIYTVNSVTPTLITPGLFYFITESVTPDGANTAEWGSQENNLGPPMEIGYYSGTNGVSGSWFICK